MHWIKGRRRGRTTSSCGSRQLQPKTYELFHSGTFHSVFLDKLWTRGGLLYIYSGNDPSTEAKTDDARDRKRLLGEQTGSDAQGDRRASGCEHRQFSVGTEGGAEQTGRHGQVGAWRGNLAAVF